MLPLLIYYWPSFPTLCTIGILLFLYNTPRKILWLIAKWNVSYAGKTILITGDNSRIKEEIVTQMLDLGAKKVIISGSKLSELERIKEVCKDKRGEVKLWEVDLSDYFSYNTALEYIK